MPLLLLVDNKGRRACTAECFDRGFKLGLRAERADGKGQRRVRSVLADTRVLHGGEVPANLLSSRPELEVLEKDNKNRLCG